MTMAEASLQTPNAASLASLENAARGGGADAQASFGIALFRAGRMADAIPWFRQAARSGEARAQYMLGVALHNGDGCTRDEGLALGLLAAAADQGVIQARRALDVIMHARADVQSNGTAPANGLSDVVTAMSARRNGDAAIEKVVAAILPDMLRKDLDVLLPEAAARLVREEMDRLLGTAQANPERS